MTYIEFPVPPLIPKLVGSIVKPNSSNVLSLYIPKPKPFPYTIFCVLELSASKLEGNKDVLPTELVTTNLVSAVEPTGLVIATEPVTTKSFAKELEIFNTPVIVVLPLTFIEPVTTNPFSIPLLNRAIPLNIDDETGTVKLSVVAKNNFAFDGWSDTLNSPPNAVPT